LETYDALLVLDHALDPSELRIETGALRIEQSKQIGSALLVGLLGDVGNRGAVFTEWLQRIYNLVAPEIVFQAGAEIVCPHFGLSLHQQLLLSMDFRGGYGAISLVSIRKGKGDLNPGQGRIGACVRVHQLSSFVTEEDA